MEESRVMLGLVCNSPLGIPPEQMKIQIEASGMGGYFNDMQFSSENGMVRPHARPFRYSLSNMDVAPGEAAVLTGLPGEMEILNRLCFGGVFVPEQPGVEWKNAPTAVRALSEMSRYV
jgi:hypothetical protein